MADGLHTPSSIQWRSWVSASSSAHEPIGTMVPVSSAIGMNSAGETMVPSRLLPAHQRLEADDVAGGQVEDRLVVHAQLATVERAVERGLHGEAVRHPFVHRLVVDGHAVAAGVLGPVHRRVGVTHEVLGRGAGRWR